MRFTQNMKVAIPQWQDRVSPVFDVARSVLVLDVAGSREQIRDELLLADGGLLDRARGLRSQGVQLLICGMVSRPQEMALWSQGIRVIPHICGRVEDVIAALLDGRLQGSALLMPGCCRRGRGYSYRHRVHGACRSCGQRMAEPTAEQEKARGNAG